jgi:hypothetical protein
VSGLVFVLEGLVGLLVVLVLCATTGVRLLVALYKGGEVCCEGSRGLWLIVNGVFCYDFLM